jgi:signal transduction histidine kinase
MLLLPLLLIPILLTSVSLLVLQQQMQIQMRESLAADLVHSAATYRNLETQRREALRRLALLLSYQPSLRALMTTGDRQTIQDAGGAYARLSGADLFALLAPDDNVVALYGGNATAGVGEARERFAKLLSDHRSKSKAVENDAYLFNGDTLFEVATQPVYFGSVENGTLLGYVVVGAKVDNAVARQVSQTASSEIAFTVGRKIVGTTLDADSQNILSLHELGSSKADKSSSPGVPLTLDVKASRFLVNRIPLANEEGQEIAMVVLRSMAGSRHTQERLNRIVLAIGGIASLAGVLLAFFVARSLTSPLEALAAGVTAVGTGDYQAVMPLSGASEIRALSRSIEMMRAQIRETQTRLIRAEQLATIGQMASSVSHDLRHYLASVYANAEFLAAAELSSEERIDLLSEIKLSVQGTIDLIDSLLLFTSTGRVLHFSFESVAYLAEGAIHRVSKHPEASGVSIEFHPDEAAEAWVDANKIERAVYNLVLNACQAARKGQAAPWVKVEIGGKDNILYVDVSDSGPGVPASIRGRLFEPFVSANKENGIGIGLTLAATIAHEHGGAIHLESSSENDGQTVTVFRFAVNREAGRPAEEGHSTSAPRDIEAGSNKDEPATPPSVNSTKGLWL